jgi:hypothetical protein
VAWFLFDCIWFSFLDSFSHISTFYSFWLYVSGSDIPLPGGPGFCFISYFVPSHSVFVGLGSVGFGGGVWPNKWAGK